MHWWQCVRLLHAVWGSCSLIPRLPLFLTPFTFTILHGVEDLPIPCIIVNANGRSKRGRPGTEAKVAVCVHLNHEVWYFLHDYILLLLTWFSMCYILTESVSLPYTTASPRSCNKSIPIMLKLVLFPGPHPAFCWSTCACTPHSFTSKLFAVARISCATIRSPLHTNLSWW